MPTHQVLDHTGHTETVWDKSDIVAVAAAEARFKELTGKGYLPVKPSGDGTPGTVVRQFDPEADIVFQPQLQGG